MPAPYTKTDNNIIWILPLPSTAIVASPSIQKLPKRELELTFSLQEEEEEPKTYVIKYSGVESFKFTYLNACNKDMITTAYDKLVDCGRTEWLKECEEISSRVDVQKTLHHYRIFFDEGPCFEVISELVSIIS